MMSRALFLGLAALAGAAWAQAAPDRADPLLAPECRAAMARLQQQEDASRARHAPTPPASLLASRRQAARACLGGRGDPPVPEQVAVPPVTVPSLDALSAPPPRAALPGVPPLPALPAPPRPLETITQCDSGGCWTSEGHRLNRVGGTLVGPSGLCSAPAGVVSCR